MPVGIYTRTKYHRDLMKEIGKSSKGHISWNKDLTKETDIYIYLKMSGEKESRTKYFKKICLTQ